MAQDVSATGDTSNTIRVPNPDIERFESAFKLSIAFVILSLIFALLGWANQSDVLFMKPSFPVLACVDTLLPASTCEGVTAANRNYYTAYSDLKTILNVNNIPRMKWWQPSVYRFIESFALALGFVVPLFSYGRLAKYARQADVDKYLFWLRWVRPLEAPAYSRMDQLKNLLSITIIHLTMAALVVAIMMFVSESFILIYSRIVIRPIFYHGLTTTFFASLVVGLLTFVLVQWLVELRLTNLSALAITILIFGLLMAMVLTNWEWSRVGSNAFSIMSLNADPANPAFNFFNIAGSQLPFRFTFITLGVLLMIFSFELRNIIKMIKEEIERHGNNVTCPDLWQFWRIIWRALTLRSVQAEIYLCPNVVGGLGITAGLLISFVGWFTLDPNDSFPSVSLHTFGAFGSTVVLWLMMLLYPVIGHPVFPEGKFHSPYQARLRKLGQACFYVGIVIALLHLAIPFIIKFINFELVNLVTLEFVILVSFSLFIYVYAVYTTEYVDEHDFEIIKQVNRALSGQAKPQSVPPPPSVPQQQGVVTKRGASLQQQVTTLVTGEPSDLGKK